MDSLSHRILLQFPVFWCACCFSIVGCIVLLEMVEKKEMRMS